MIDCKQLRVGRYDWKTKTQPQTPGYKNELVHVVQPLSPFVLKENGCIMENIWQFQKCYPRVSAQRPSRTSKWKHKEEVHWDNEKKQPTDAYWKWREKGLNFQFAVRWPNGYYGAKECLFHIVEEDGKLKTLDYISARKQIYYQVYSRLARETKAFALLKERLQKGEKIQINEVDGPKYSEQNPFHLVENNSIPISKEIVRSWLQNSTQPFGHGMCLVVALLDWDDVIHQSL